jgi:hypothetical protein
MRGARCPAIRGERATAQSHAGWRERLAEIVWAGGGVSEGDAAITHKTRVRRDLPTGGLFPT